MTGDAKAGDTQLGLESLRHLRVIRNWLVVLGGFGVLNLIQLPSLVLPASATVATIPILAVPSLLMFIAAVQLIRFGRGNGKALLAALRLLRVLWIAFSVAGLVLAATGVGLTLRNLRQ